MPWFVHAIDDKGKPRKFYMRAESGPELSEAVAIERGKSYVRNWTFVRVEFTDLKEPPANKRPIDPRAHNFGVLESLNSRRRR